MKPSPLRLKLVTYPAASFEAADSSATPNLAIEPIVDANVRFNTSGEHWVYLHVRSKDEPNYPYSFSVTVVAVFDIEHEIAKVEYKPKSARDLVRLISVNISRIVFASAREYIAAMTSRSTYGTAMLESVLLEPKDVDISSDVEPPEMLAKVFGASDEEVAEMNHHIKELQAARDDQPVKAE